MFNSLSLRSKILAGITGLMVLLGLAALLFAKTVLYENLLGKLEKRGISVARHLAASCISPVLTEKYFELQMIAKDVMSSEEDIEYIFVLNRNGDVLAHTFDGGFPVGMLEVNKNVSGQGFSKQEIRTERGDFVDIAVPLQSGQAGVVHLGLSKRIIREEINSIVRLFLWLFAALVVAGAGMAFFLSMIIVKPVSELAKAFEAVGSGDLDHKVSTYSDDELGQLGRAFNVMVEMRKQAEEELRESHNSYQMLAENLPGLVYRVFAREKNRIHFFNKIGEKLTGYAPEELTGGELCSIESIIVPEDLPYVTSAVGKAIEQRRQFGVEYRLRHKDGHVLYCLELGTPIFGDDGKLLYIDGVIFDVTERRKLEEELLKSQRLESVGILAGGIAHDFNNLLTGIMGNISLARLFLESRAVDKIAPVLEQAEGASEAAKELSFRLLTFSKGGDPVRTTVSIEPVLRKAAGLSLKGSGITASISVADDLRPVEIDEGQMTQVFNNMLINSKEAMPHGGAIRIAADNVTVPEASGAPVKAGEYVRISIQDSGSGIARQNVTKIFDPYFSTKEMGSQKGTGLGLAVCLSIVKKHGGYITVESEEGRETTFHIYVPASAAVPRDPKAGKPGQISVSGKRLLFMDDDERMRGIFGSMMEYLGYGVEFATNGEEAIELYRRAAKGGRAFDAVILDLTIEDGMGGDEAVRKLLEFDPAVRAVISTGYVDDPVVKDFRLHGFVDAIAKPYKTSELRALLDRLFGHEGSHVG